MSLSKYQSLITSARQTPNMLAVIQAITQGHLDNQAILATLPGLFDLDSAIGQQLDFTGQWVGRTRNLEVPLSNVYFSFDETGLGFDQGTWLGPFDPTSGLVSLPDDAYRILLKTVVASNQWDGTIPSAYTDFENLFNGSGITILIQDGEDMTMIFGIVGATPSAVTLALLTTGELQLKPAGVRSIYVDTSVTGLPLFGLDVQNANIAGFDAGTFPSVILSD